MKIHTFNALAVIIAIVVLLATVTSQFRSLCPALLLHEVNVLWSTKCFISVDKSAGNVMTNITPHPLQFSWFQRLLAIFACIKELKSKVAMALICVCIPLLVISLQQISND